MCHIDAHPDLSINQNCKVAKFRDTEYLYSLLNYSDGAISEFILPLIVNGHINEMIWVKPHWSTQISSGAYSFLIGDHHESLLGNVSLQNR